MRKRTVLLPTLLALIFMFALGVASASAAETTWNPNDKNSSVTLSNNNLTASVNSVCAGRATQGKSTGKWYWENSIISGSYHVVGAGNINATLASCPGVDANGWGYYVGATKLHEVETPYGDSWGNGDVIGIALDMDNKTITFYKNGVSQGEAFTNLIGVVYPMVGCGSSFSSCSVTANFGTTAFAYPIPTGFQPFDGTQSIPAPTGLTATPGNTQVSLSWTGVTGATSYKVYMGTTSGTYEPTPVAIVNAPVVTATISNLQNGLEYFFVVKAVTTSGESSNSDPASATPQPDPIPPTGNGTLVVTVANNTDREYNLTMVQIQAFIDWYNNRSTGGNVYTIEKPASGAYTRIKDYLIFDKIVAWEVKEY